MSKAHPIIAVTGSSGAGTTTVRDAFCQIFIREKINPVFIQGDSFRRYDREGMKCVAAQPDHTGKPSSHFGPDCNLFDELERTFREYGQTGTGKRRHYISNQSDAETYGLKIGDFTPWEDLPADSDLMLYEGLHGGVVASTWTRRSMSHSHNPRVIEERRRQDGQNRGVDAAQWVDLLIGVVPSVNLEWIQKIHRDCAKKDCSPEAVTATILRRMHDYVYYITPQFSLTDINFQRVPIVDTSNPFIAMDIPSYDESMVVIRFREPKKHNVPELLRKIDGAFMSRANTIVAPGGEMITAMNIVCTPIINSMMEDKAVAGKRRPATRKQHRKIPIA